MALNFYKIIVVLSVYLGIISCVAPIHRSYSGPPLAHDEVCYVFYAKENIQGVVEQGYAQIPKNAYVERIDGRRVGFSLSQANRIELLPGAHTLDITYFESIRDGWIESAGFFPVTFDCKAGETYWIDYVISKEDLWWRPYITDKL